jgi:hypothetical protein
MLKSAVAQHRMRRQARRLAALPPAILLVCAIVRPVAADVDVRVEGGQISADLSQVPIADVLTAVAEQTGARLSIHGDLGTVRPQAFSRLPIVDALPRLAQPNGVLLQFAPAESGGGRRLIAIRVVAPGTATPAGDGAGRSASKTPAVARQDPRKGLPAGFWDYEKSDPPVPEVEERITQLENLARARGPGSTAAVTYVVTADPDPQVRKAAIGLMAGLPPSDDGRTALLQAAADADPDVRAEALRALSRGRERPIALLAQALKGDADANVRIAAIENLSGKDGDFARAVLEGALSDADPHIREAAKQALARR